MDTESEISFAISNRIPFFDITECSCNAETIRYDPDEDVESESQMDDLTFETF